MGPRAILDILEREKTLTPARIQTLPHAACSLIAAIPTMLFWLVVGPCMRRIVTVNVGGKNFPAIDKSLVRMCLSFI
jgi:hypothetical protein